MINRDCKLISYTNIISSVSAEYKNLFIVELCSILSICKAIDFIMPNYSALKLKLGIKTGTDCQFVIHTV